MADSVPPPIPRSIQELPLSPHDRYNSVPPIPRPTQETSTLAVVSLVLGVIGLPVMLFAIAAVICGHIALSKVLDQTPRTAEEKDTPLPNSLFGNSSAENRTHSCVGHSARSDAGEPSIFRHAPPPRPD